MMRGWDTHTLSARWSGGALLVPLVGSGAEGPEANAFPVDSG